MSAAKFTPGPWSVVPVSGDTMIRAANGDNVARVCVYGPQADLPHAERANARLIAAAPTMLSALQEALAYFEDREDTRDGVDGEPFPNAEMYVAIAIRAAIAKAGAAT